MNRSHIGGIIAAIVLTIVIAGLITLSYVALEENAKIHNKTITVADRMCNTENGEWKVSDEEGNLYFTSPESCTGFITGVQYQISYKHIHPMTIGKDYDFNTIVGDGIPVRKWEITESKYGCPGCPDSFMDFAHDMCNRLGESYTVEDGYNRISCSEILEMEK